MRAIGIRVTPKIIYYTISESIDDEIAIGENGVEQLIVPKSFDIPKRLTYIRQTLYSIINEFEILNAGIRVVENNTKNFNIERINLEGVIQELLANSTVEDYFLGTINTLSKFLKIKNTTLSDALKDGKELPDYSFEDWSSMKREERECLLTSISALQLGRSGS